MEQVMKRNILILILLIGLGAAGVFAFFQTSNLADLQNNSTEVIAALEGSSTQAVNSGIATGTALADSAHVTTTHAAQDFNDAAATSTRAAIINDENNQSIFATSSQAANDAAATTTQAANEANSTGTALVDTVNATGTALAAAGTELAAEFDEFMTISGNLAIESGNLILTLSADVEAANTAQTTLQAQNTALVGTLEASGWVGEGIFGETAILPHGFERYQGNGYEIALPASFDGADLSGNPRSFFSLLDSLGLASVSEYLRQQDENFLFFGIDTNLVNDLPRATVSIVRDIPGIESTLGDYLGGAYVGIEANAALIITDEIPLNGQVAGRSIVEQTFENGAVRQMQYIFQAEGSFYVITFTVPVGEFAALRPVLEQSAGTFRLRD
jgi:hypothetical protein